MRPSPYRVSAIALVTMLCPWFVEITSAADHIVLGKKFVIAGVYVSVGPGESSRSVVVKGVDGPTSLPPGPPPLPGPTATITVITHGDIPTTESYPLTGTWIAAGPTGWRYRASGLSPVKSMTLKRAPSGAASLKVVIRGAIGTEVVNVVAPGQGTDAGLVFDDGVGTRYCVQLGGAAGGYEARDGLARYILVANGAAPAVPLPCPPPPTCGIPVTAWGSEGSGDGEFRYVRGIAIAASGDVYVVDHSNHRIQRFDTSGTFLGKWGAHGSGVGAFDQPADIAIDSAGNVYVTDEGNDRVQKFSATGTFLTAWAVGDRPAGIAISGTTVLVATPGLPLSGGDVHAFALDGTPLGLFVSGFSGKDIEVDSSGNVYVVSSTHNEIRKYSGAGALLAVFGGLGLEDGALYVPTGTAVASASGDIFVSEVGRGRVQRLDPSGAFVTKWGSPGDGLGRFRNAWDIALDGLGDVYVTDLHRVQRFACP